MIFAFIFLVLLLIVCVCSYLFLLRYFRRPQAIDTEQKDAYQSNLDAAKERVAILNNQLDESNLDAAKVDEFNQEIEQQLLEDIHTVDKQQLKRNKDLSGALIVLVAIFLVAPLLYLMYGSLDHVLPDKLRMALIADNFDNETLELLSKQSVEARLELATKLMEKEQYSEAAKIYAQVRNDTSDSPQLLAANLNALIRARENFDDVLALGLTNAPNDPFFLWIAGLQAQEQGDFEQAISYWGKTRDVLPANSQEQQNVISAINDLAEAVATQQQLTNDLDNQTEVTDSNQFVQVNVSMSPALADQINDDDVLFIFAQAQNGPVMPLAVHKINAGELPLTIKLDDAMAMMPTLKMSLFDAYKIVARVSKHGDVVPKSGDLFGQINANPGDSVAVVIDQLVP